MHPVRAIATCAGLLLLSVTPSSARDQRSPSDWLMVVKSINTDPARTTEFNRWYDDIDLPDVLEVPGYMRARRGQRVDRPAERASTDAADAYVALYDIRSVNLDRTIIAMLMASWRMDQLGRSTDLIKVVERVYYRRARAPVEAAGAGSPGWILLLRTDALPDARSLKRLAAAGTARRATPYALDRVLMHEPRTVPAYLTIFEIDASTQDAAAAAAATIQTAVSGRDHGLYRLIKDQARP